MIITAFFLMPIRNLETKAYKQNCWNSHLSENIEDPLPELIIIKLSKAFDKGSKVAKHAWTFDHVIDLSNSTIIGKGNNRTRKIMESRHTAKIVDADITSCPLLRQNKVPAKRSQHFNPTYRNIVGCNMLRAFGRLVATCCDMLGVVGSNLKMVKFFI